MTVASPPDHDPSPSPARRGWIAAGVLAAVLVLGATALVLLTSRGAGPVAPGGGAPATTTAAVPTSAAPATTPPASTLTSAATTPTPTPTAPVVPADAVTAVWPTATTSVRYADPVAAARGFAVRLAGFRTPVLGRFQAGDSRSGEVEVRPEPTGPVTTVLVRKLGDGTWWVLGSATADIRLDTPGAGDLLTSPATLTGQALAFEGVVGVRISDDAGTTLATGSVVGGGDVARPFSGTFRLATPRTAYGAVVLTTASARDGQVWTASVLRVKLR